MISLPLPQVLMASIAEQCRHHQVLLLQSTLSFASAWAEKGAWRPVAAFWHAKYDETPLRMKVLYHDQCHPTGSETQDITTGKVFAIENEWALLLKDPEDNRFLFLRGAYAPSMRISDAGSAKGVCSVLASCPEPSEPFFAQIPVKIRLVETDALRANLAGERLLQTLPVWQQWQRSHWTCLAHKIHMSATKSWTLEQNSQVISGVTHLALFLNSPGGLAQFRAILHKLVSNTLVVDVGRPQLSQAAQTFRFNCMQTYAPRSVKGRVLLTLLARTLLNSDWRSQTLTHHCEGCCESRAGTLAKLHFALDALLTAARPQLVSKANWRQWWKSFCFVGIFGNIHGILHRIIAVQLGADGQELVDDGIENAHQAVGIDPAQGEDMALGAGVGDMRGLAAQAPDMVDGPDLQRMLGQRRQHARNFLADPLVFDRCYCLVQSLVPEIRLMESLLNSEGKMWEQEQMAKQLRGQLRDYKIHLCCDGGPVRSIFHAMMQGCGSRLDNRDLWSHLTPSQLLANEMAMSLLRSCSIIYQTCHLAFQNFPFKLLQLVSPVPQVSVAAREELASIDRCRLDPFTVSFLEAFPDPRTEEALATLRGMVCLLDGSTASTEQQESQTG